MRRCSHAQPNSFGKFRLVNKLSGMDSDQPIRIEGDRGARAVDHVSPGHDIYDLQQ